MKNNKIMGQILKNHYGTIEKTKVEEMISIIASSGLRLVKMTIQEEEKNLTAEELNVIFKKGLKQKLKGNTAVKYSITTTNFFNTYRNILEYIYMLWNLENEITRRNILTYCLFTF